MAEGQAPEPAVNPGRDVFISYASQDAAVANELVETLERHSIRCWIAPRDVKAGAQYADAIIRALTNARVMVLVLSAHSIASSHVGKEIERASSKKRPIIALRTDSAPLTPALEYFLSESQWIEVKEGKTEAACAKLIDAIRDPERAAPTGTSAAPAPVALRKSRRNRLLFAAGLALVAVTFVALYAPRFWPAKHSAADLPSPVISPSAPTATISENSIAVLPFVDMSEKHDQEYFSDGLSEELIDHLAHIPDLKVIARTSSFAFKGKNEDMRSIATKLGVANLLEGSVRKAGGELRITVQLIRASDGVHLWSETYDRKLADIFKVQDEISTTVAKALNATLNGANATGVQPASKGTTNVDAYNLFLQGTYFFFRGNSGDDAKAAEYLRKALDLDSQYATAWARLARVYAYSGLAGELSSVDAEARARDAVQRALAIDPNCAEAYYASGNISRQVAGDWAAAKTAYEKAVVLDPHGEMGERARGIILLLKAIVSGNYNDYIDTVHRTLERSPLDTDRMFELALYQQFNGQLAESAATYRKLLELNPAYATGQAQYGIILLLMGKKPEALAVAQQESDEASKFIALASVYWAMGRQADSDSALASLERGYAHANAYGIAQVHAYRGEPDAAFAWLERADQHVRGSLEDVKFDPMFRNLHSDPRWTAFLRKMNLP